ncbi:MAG: hypothetical protein QNK89_04445 [Lacinutrix sp.]|uniref:hypothetical protein n=1 Tax=Lacinutrix sp. TaxID=1937692 RepID=UPI0030B7E53D
MTINYHETIEKLRQIRNGSIKEGLRLDIPDIDEHIRFKPSNFNVILGQANVGKTSAVLFLMLCYSIKHKKKWLVFSSENEPHSIVRKLVEYLANKPINMIDELEFIEHTEFIDDHFKIISPDKLYTYRDLISLAKAYKDAWDYDGFMIDPYNSIVKDPELMKSIGGHEYDYQATTEFRIFCKQNNITIWLNVHANTGAIRILHKFEHKYAGYPVPPQSGDVEGGAKFVNRADDFWVIHRYVQHPTDFMITQIHVRKVKEVETGGRPTPLDFPVPLRSVKNNVGFSVEDQNLIKKIEEDTKANKFLKSI